MKPVMITTTELRRLVIAFAAFLFAMFMLCYAVGGFVVYLTLKGACP